MDTLWVRLVQYYRVYFIKNTPTLKLCVENVQIYA